MFNTLISRILQYRSLSIVGMAKNTGKTVCLNYILDQLHATDKVVAVTSIGLDGEKTDQVTLTEKPEITLTAGTYFVTSEYHYRQRQLVSEICDLSNDYTALGRLVTARVLQEGKVILTGPASSARTRQLIEQLQTMSIDLTIIDGALSRKSPSSPAITDSLILTTGAAIAADFNAIVTKTEFIYQLTQLPELEHPKCNELFNAAPGIYALEGTDVFRLPIASPLLFTKCKEQLFSHGNTLVISGIVTDNILEYLRMQPNIKDIHLIIQDFTKLFATPYVLHGYLRKGGQLSVLKRPNLLAICINPTSPTGFNVNSEQLQQALQERISVPVVDVKQQY